METGWGRSSIGNNLFGIKANASWKGKTQTVRTHEFVNGKKVYVDAKFRDYNSIEESLEDRFKLLSNSRYKKVVQAKNYKEAANEIYKAGYATDPQYPNKLIQIIEQNKLYLLDEQAKGSGVKMKKDNMGLVKYAEKAYSEKWGYVWGTFGQILTDNLLNQKLKQYPKGVGNYISFIRSNWLGRRTADCIGLIKAYLWFNESTNKIVYDPATDINADVMYQRATKKGNINSIPEIAGICVWRKGHIGVYIGNGWVIEAQGTTSGVRKNRLKDRNFTHWLEIPYLEYRTAPAKPTPPKKPIFNRETGIIKIYHRNKDVEIKGIIEKEEGKQGITQYIAIRDMETLGYKVEWNRGTTELSEINDFRKFNLNMDYVIDSLDQANVKVKKNNKSIVLNGFKVTDKNNNITQFIKIRDLEKLGFKIEWDQANKKVVII